MKDKFVLFVELKLSDEAKEELQKVLKDSSSRKEQLNVCSCCIYEPCRSPFKFLDYENLIQKSFNLSQNTCLSIPSVFESEKKLRDTVQQRINELNTVVYINTETGTGYLYKGDIEPYQFRQEYVPTFLEMYSLFYEEPAFEIKIIKDIRNFV